jgi:hypothetical protein
MKRVLFALVLVFGCVDQNAPPPPNAGDGLPPILGTGNTGGSGLPDAGVDAGVDAGTDGGASSGACDNAGDLGAIEGASSTRNTANACSANDCAFWIADPTQYEICVSTCVENGIRGLSPECAACYGGLERCSLEALCRPFCVNNDACNIACTSCLRNYGCSEEFEACRGLPGDGCPSSG